LISSSSVEEEDNDDDDTEFVVDKFFDEEDFSPFEDENEKKNVEACGACGA
jgi:hypothetical protein